MAPKVLDLRIASTLIHRSKAHDLSFTDEEVDNNDGESHNDLEQVEHYLPTCRMESCPEGKGVAMEGYQREEEDDSS